MSMHVPCVTTHATKLPICIPTSIAFKRYKRPWPKDVGFPFFSGNLSSLNKLGLSEIASPFLGSHQSPQMEAHLGISIPESEKYSKELDVAVRVVQMACCICQRVQESLIQSSNGLIKSKEDDSPVTVAGNDGWVSVGFAVVGLFGSPFFDGCVLNWVFVVGLVFFLGLEMILVRMCCWVYVWTLQLGFFVLLLILFLGYGFALLLLGV